MALTIRVHHKPTSVEEAQQMLRRGGETAAYLAGGTALLAHPQRPIETVVDLSGLGLDYIRRGADERGAPRLEIGAMTTLQTLVDSPQLASFAGGLLATAAHHTATRTIRNAATVGGSIGACGQTSDIIVALLALQAEVVAGNGRLLTLEDILANRYPTQTPRLYTEIHVYEIFSGLSSSFLRVARLPSDQAIVNVAVAMHLEGGVCARACVAAGGIAEKPRRLEIPAAMLERRVPDAAHVPSVVDMTMATVHPESDVFGSADYRRAMMGVLLRRAVEQCVAQEKQR